MTKTTLKHCKSLAPWKQNSGLRLLHRSITSTFTTGGWLEGSSELNWQVEVKFLPGIHWECDLCNRIFMWKAVSPQRLDRRGQEQICLLVALKGRQTPSPINPGCWEEKQSFLTGMVAFDLSVQSCLPGHPHKCVAVSFEGVTHFNSSPFSPPNWAPSHPHIHQRLRQHLRKRKNPRAVRDNGAMASL